MNKPKIITNLELFLQKKKQLFLYTKVMVHIFEAQITDAPLIAEFQVAMAWESECYKLDKKKIDAGVLAVFKDKAKGKYFVAKNNVNKTVASLLVTYEWSDWRNAWVWWIQSVYVVPEYRRQGIFSKLYDHIKSEVNKSSSFVGIRLYVEKENTKAIETYNAMAMNGEHYRLFEWMKF